MQGVIPTERRNRRDEPVARTPVTDYREREQEEDLPMAAEPIRPDRDTHGFTAADRKHMLILLALALAVGGRWMVANETPEFPVAEGSLRAGPNAVHFYKAASEILELPEAWYRSTNAHLPALTMADMKATVVRNAASLQLVRKGFAYRYQGWGITWTWSPRSGGMITGPGNIGNLADVMAYESRVRAAQGDASGALNAGLDAIRLGQDLTRCPVGDGYRVERLGVTEALKNVRQLNAEEARQGIGRLTEILRQEQPFTEHAAQTREFGLSTLMMQFSMNPSIRSAPEDMGKHMLVGSYIFWYGKEETCRAYQAYMNAIVARAGLPFQKFKRLPSVPRPDNPLMQSWLSDGFSGYRSFTKTSAWKQVLRTELAIQAFRQENNNRYPRNLVELTQGDHPYLSALPRDPFSADGQQPLHYNGWNAYSVGENGRDEGGDGDDIVRRDP